ncbi:unnamed protein product [Echinostoma caproni]|uniref:Secreted protein n=1 Tax=Echinostoma caproni TaxID=27848 RepID=A0A3P8GBZ5_9TREM|nr:unnamed protein product [Echinostoma caproni]
MVLSHFALFALVVRSIFQSISSAPSRPDRIVLEHVPVHRVQQWSVTRVSSHPPDWSSLVRTGRTHHYTTPRGDQKTDETSTGQVASATLQAEAGVNSVPGNHGFDQAINY